MLFCEYIYILIILIIMIRAIKSDIGSRDRKEARQVVLVRRKCCATVDDGGSHNAAPVAIPEAFT